MTKKEILGILSYTDMSGAIDSWALTEETLFILRSRGFIDYADTADGRGSYYITNRGRAFIGAPQQYTLPIGERVIVMQESIRNEDDEVWAHIVCSRKAFAMIQEMEKNWREQN